jgi:5-methylcytosine-specific restriction protein A
MNDPQARHGNVSGFCVHRVCGSALRMLTGVIAALLGRFLPRLSRLRYPARNRLAFRRYLLVKISTLKPLVPRGDGRTVIPAPSPSQGTIDPVYNDERYKVWRKAVVANARFRCEAIDNGFRCVKSAPASRLFADHIIELRDDGSPFDPANGQCLCGRHHSLKTAAARARRAGVGGGPISVT